MALYVYITSKCKEKAQRHNRLREMEQLKDKVEGIQRICHFDNFPPPYLKKRFDRQIRLIANYRYLTVAKEQHLVVCFLDILIRGGEYEDFCRNPSGFGDTYLAPLVDDEKLRDFLIEKLKKDPPEPKPSPSSTEHDFLYHNVGKGLNQEDDGFICESSKWVEKVSTKKTQQMLLYIFEALPEMINSKSTKTTIRKATLIHRWFPHLNKLFLAGIADNESEIEKIEKDYSRILSEDEAEISEETLLRLSMRNYPALLLADEESWIEIEKDEESNLALSPEETEVLESVHRNDGYPVFINGRAGSGKSTILYYLFSDYVNLYLQHVSTDKQAPPLPIILSCSEELKTRSRQTVNNLIRCNPRWRNEDIGDCQVPEECFQEFHDFLYKHLPETDWDEKFPLEKYIDYATFKRLWNKQFEHDNRLRKTISSDISWHIIRTYIKGTNPEEYLEPEDYETLPKKQKSVSIEAYETVYEKIWLNWYRSLCKQEGYWDDQDLARRIFAEGLARPVYAAVFCDEAQDFTRVELDIIFRLCLFTERKLGYADITRVPFAFAGDPFQTLNPTGFRWDAVQASFHDKLADIFTLGGGQGNSISFNYRELNLNYRSTRNIVRLCNFIQALRAALFDLPDLRPQDSWQMETGSPFPVWFDCHQPGDWEQLRKEKDITIIVPCMLNEEKEFVQNDELLREVVQTDDSGVPLNVLSPARAKGLEFARVVLYRFADNIPNNFLELLEKKGAELEQDLMLPCEYFINQLYVAASRPKRRLFIIDSQQSRENFWSLANDDSLQEKIWGKFPQGRDIWTGMIGGFQSGTRESWSEERGNPEENAEMYEKRGLSSRDPFLLRSAALSYESIGKTRKAKSCKAQALRFEERYREAGDIFSESHEPEQALSCYWLAGTDAKTGIQNLANNYPEIANRIEYKLIYTLENPTSGSIIERLKELATRAREDSHFRQRIATEAAFSSIIDKFLKHLLNISASKKINLFLGPLETILEQGVRLNPSILAECYYGAGKLNEAVIWWERSSNYFTNENYRKAKALLLAARFKADDTLALNDREKKILAEHFREQNEYLLLLRCLKKTSSPFELIETLATVPENYPKHQDFVIDLADALAQQGEWKLLIELAGVSQGEKAWGVMREHRGALRKKARDIRNAVIIACARNSSLGQQDNKILEQFSNYFRKTLASPKQWRDQLTLEVTGAAIERAGRFIDILPFYEKVIADSSFSGHEINFAKKRWVKNKEKQITREMERGLQLQARQHQRDLQMRSREFGLEGKTIPDFPEITTIWARKNETEAPYEKATLEKAKDTECRHEIPAPAAGEQNRRQTSCQPLSFDIGHFHLEFNPKKGRINITLKETLDVASIRADRNQMSSADVVITHTGQVFTCKEWNCKCDLSDLTSEGKVKIYFTEFCLALEFQFQTQD
jgi:hypothetical protein